MYICMYTNDEPFPRVIQFYHRKMIAFFRMMNIIYDGSATVLTKIGKVYQYQIYRSSIQVDLIEKYLINGLEEKKCSLLTIYKND